MPLLYSADSRASCARVLPARAECAARPGTRIRSDALVRLSVLVKSAVLIKSTVLVKLNGLARLFVRSGVLVRSKAPIRLEALARLGALVSGTLALAACTTCYQPMGPARATPVISGDTLISIDGARLPVRHWRPEQTPWAIIVALHGMNDYSNAFDQAARYWATQGIATYAYDQRGFGAGPRPGIWADTPTMVADLNAAVDAVSAAHPGLPVYVLGESMGGAVVTAALAGTRMAHESPLAHRVAGVILSAPAMWGRQVMNPFYRFTLWLSYHTVPGLEVEPPRGLKIMPSDNIEMLRALSKDPLVIKRTRIDAIKGLVDLMTDAEAALPALPMDVPMLVLFGRHEQVLPGKVVTATLQRIEATPAELRPRVALYDNGYHMLLRDLQARVVWRDIAVWMRAPVVAALPSGAEQHYPAARANTPNPGARQAHAGHGAGTD